MLHRKFILTCLTILIFLLAACTQPGKNSLQTIRVNVDEDFPADSFFSAYTFIQLDSTTTPMVSDVRDIRFHDQCIYILDDNGRVFTFDTNGHHMGTLDSMGLGEGEYATADAFDITGAGIFVLSRPQKRIMQYTFDGHLTRIIPLHDYYLDLRVLSDSSIVLASGNCNNRMFNFMTYNMKSGNFTHEAAPFERTESFTSDAYHPFVGQSGDTLLVSSPFETKIMLLCGDETAPFKTYAFNTDQQMPEPMEDYTFEEIAQMTRHKHVVRGIALYKSTQQADYIGYELFGKCGLSFQLARSKPDGSVQNMTIMNNPEPTFPYLSAPLGAIGDRLASVMPAYALLQTEKAYGLNKFTSMGLHPTDNPIVFLHKLR